jgi:O-antigen/teichoic acid export membrane protein
MSEQNPWRFLSFRSTRQLALVIGGNLLCIVLGFFAYWIVSQRLSLADFGVFNVVLATIYLVPLLVGMGINPGVMRNAPFYRAREAARKARLLVSTAFWMKLFLGIAAFLGLFLFARIISVEIFHTSEYTDLIRLAAVGVFGMIFLQFIKSLLFAEQSFFKALSAQVLADAGKLALVLMLFWKGPRDVFFFAAVYSLFFFIGLAPGFLSARRCLGGEGTFSAPSCREILSYGKWNYLSSLLLMARRKIGLYLLVTMDSAEAGGLYGLAEKLVFLIPILVSSVYTVFLPKLAGVVRIEELRRYARRSFILAAVSALPILPFLFISKPIILGIFGEKYHGVTPIFSLLLLGEIMSFVTAPLRVILHAVKRHYVVTAWNVVQLIGVIGMSYYLIPRYSVLAPAFAMLIFRFVAVTHVCFYIWRILRREGQALLDSKAPHIGRHEKDHPDQAGSA